MANKMKWYDLIAYGLVTIGALNWGLIGFMKFNLVYSIFGTMQVIERSIYGIVGIAGLYSIYTLIKLLK